jgi:hypothetical protein
MKHELRTINPKTRPLVYQENGNYGYNRNLLGMKKIGMLLAVIGALVSIGASLWLSKQGTSAIGAWVCAAIDIVIFFGWTLVTEKWVRVPARFRLCRKAIPSLFADASPD